MGANQCIGQRDVFWMSGYNSRDRYVKYAVRKAVLERDKACVYCKRKATAYPSARAGARMKAISSLPALTVTSESRRVSTPGLRLIPVRAGYL